MPLWPLFSVHSLLARSLLPEAVSKSPNLLRIWTPLRNLTGPSIRRLIHENPHAQIGGWMTTLTLTRSLPNTRTLPPPSAKSPDPLHPRPNRPSQDRIRHSLRQIYLLLVRLLPPVQRLLRSSTLRSYARMADAALPLRRLWRRRPAWWLSLSLRSMLLCLHPPACPTAAAARAPTCRCLKRWTTGGVLTRSRAPAPNPACRKALQRRQPLRLLSR